ncbi:flagellar export protein FliJ [Buchnera aphidicola (Macrosiphoniella sanborni)]|uniref:Flagellar FliJ protein n=1 Tax=Buchnera aphidicola (Macrosiphoniella sanborni) TaxID=1241865 RepID=A0A4D6YCD9_9GAMM|nr:flagellar FliJ family protein [Buchnera aphidicola]QCI23644.1 flagellar export protein FliJ [Buchnera aphidicola (Macrosiphoniella sanborni)]
MEYKKKIFSILEKIEQKKIEQNLVNIKRLFLREKEHVDQLNILIDFQKEYLKKMNEKMKLGMSIHSWKNYNNFILLLDKAIQENLYFIENNKKNIQDNIKIWSKHQVKLNTWTSFNRIYKKKISKKIQKIQEQIMSDNFIQLKYFKKDDHLNVRNSK